MASTKFSITIPAYKRTYLKEAIDSCLAQTYQDFELIIVNDASPEDLDSIVNAYTDSRIRYYTNEKNCGAVDVVDNWNICLGYCTGDYVICMGDDDRLMPNCLEEYKRLIDKYPGLGVYHGQTEIIDEDSNFLSVTAMRPEYEGVFSMIWHRWFSGRSNQYIGDFLFDIKLLRINGGFFKLPLAWSSDDISACLAASKAGIANTQKVVFQYRVNSQTISKTGNHDLKLKAIHMEELWYDNFIHIKAIDEKDEKYRQCVERNIKKHFIDKKKSLMQQEMRAKGWSVGLKWITNRRTIGLPLTEVMKALLKGLV